MHTTPFSPTQTRLLLGMLKQVLLEMRALAREGRSVQAADLADAFHNVPSLMGEGRLDLIVLQGYVAAYQSKYPSEAQLYNYLNLLERVAKAA